MPERRWKFRNDILGHYINSSSSRTFQDAENRLNYLEKEQEIPNMREKIKEYISELDVEIQRCHTLAEELGFDNETEHLVIRVQVLMEVKNDLESRLNEFV